MRHEVAAARRASQAASGRAGVDIYEIHDIAGIEAVAALFDEVWNGSGVVPTNLLRALSHAGAYLAGARADDRLVGASLAFFGREREAMFVHSHVTGVRRDVQARGVGRALKLHQRLWTLSHGIERIRWTFDPLVSHNAYFNLVKLGAHIDGYEVDFYGRMRDGVNEGDESDRCVVTWDLLSPPVLKASADGRLREQDVDAIRAAGAITVLDEDPGGRPVVMSTAPTHVALCKVPHDIVALRGRTPEVALSWRRALRETMGALLRSGWRATSITQSGWYVLERSEGGGGDVRGRR